jgi:hypothetical protein
MSDLNAIAAALRGSFDTTDEYRFQDGVGAALARAGIIAEREVILTPRDRIDFLVGRIGIECKVQGSFIQVARQLCRYAQCDQIMALVLVTGCARLGRGLCTSIVGGGIAKPLLVVETWKGLL